MNNRIKGHDPITVVMGNQPLVTHAAKVASDPTSTDAVVCASVRNPGEGIEFSTTAQVLNEVLGLRNRGRSWIG